MRFTFIFKLTIYLLILDVLAALAVTDALGRLELAAAAAVLVGSWWTDAVRRRVPNYRRLWDILTTAFVLYAVLDVAILADSFMAAVIHLLLFLQLYKLCNLERHRDLLDLLILTFLQLLAASTLTVHLVFLPLFCLYVLLGIWALILLHLKREAELAWPEKSQELLADRGLVTVRFLATSGGMALLCLVFTLAIFFTMPRIGRSFLPFQGPATPLTTGFTDRVDLGSFGSIQQDATIVMRVTPQTGFDRPGLPVLRWRGVALDQFDGRTWSLSDGRRRLLRRLRDGTFTMGPLRPGGPLVSYEVYLEPIGSDLVFALPRLVTLQATSPTLTQDAGDGFGLPAAPNIRIHYQALSQLETPRGEALRAAGWDYPATLRAQYLQLPPLSPQLRRLAADLAAGAATPYEVARRVDGYLRREMHYSLNLDRRSELAPLDEFLFVRKTGNCEYFATGMAVLLRAAGIPTRLVNGFQMGEWNEVGRYFAIRQRDAHSWVEIFFPGVGWVAADPTPRAAFESEAFSGSGRLAKYLDALRMHWNRYVVDYSLADQAGLATRLREQSRILSRRVSRDWSGWRLQVRRLARRITAAGLPLGLLAVLLAGAWFLLRRRAIPGADRWLRCPGASPSTVGFYERMLRLLARRGWPRSPALTAREFAASLGGRPDLSGPVMELTSLYERVRFGGEKLPPADEARAGALLRELTVRRRAATSPAR